MGLRSRSSVPATAGDRSSADPGHTWVVLSTASGPTLWRHNVLMFGSTASLWGWRTSWLGCAGHFSWFPSCTSWMTLVRTSLRQRLPLRSRRPRQLAVRWASNSKNKALPPAKPQQLLGVSLSLESDKAIVECSDERRQRLTPCCCKFCLMTS